MRGKSIALLVLALGCGLVASLGITQVMAKRGDATGPSETAPVLVATSDIGINANITKEMVKIEQWPKDKIQAGAIARLEDAENRRARQKIFAGEPLIEPRLMTRGEVATDGLIPKGYRVVSIRVDPVASHSGLLLPGARIDLQLFIQANSNTGVGETICRTILQDIRVFAVNDVVSLESPDPKQPETKSIQGKTVSLLVTPSQAETVTLAGEMGQLRLTLRNNEDNEQGKPPGAVVRGLLAGIDGSRRANEDPDAKMKADGFLSALNGLKRTLANAAAHKEGQPIPRPTAEPARWPMKVIVGGSVNDVVLVGSPANADGNWSTSGQINYPTPKSSNDSAGGKLPSMPGPTGPGESGKPASDGPSLQLPKMTKPAGKSA